MSLLSDQTKTLFRSTVTDVRTRLLTDLALAVEQRYSLAAKNRTSVKLPVDDAICYEILQNYLSGAERTYKTAQENLSALVQERAYTLFNRLVILMQLEARGLRTVRLISQGRDKSPFSDYREFFTALLQGDDSGWNFVLEQVWDELALELPALFGRNEVLDCIPIPGSTLFWLLDTLSQKDLAPAWQDDTTLGWLYQYWNDPDRKAVDDKLNTTTGKVEVHELAHKTQLFTERYMVEWLVQNSLGAQWLALCAKNAWTPQANAILADLQEKRKLMGNNLKDSHEVSLGMQSMSASEDFWKFYVEQNLDSETIAAAPDRLEDLKVLDPAMGSGHFLVYVFDFLFELYRDQSDLCSEEFNAERTVQKILEYNLHGIDIDNRAVQIAAAALYIKAREHAPQLKIGKLNLVATDLGLSKLKKDDPSLKEFYKSLEKESGITEYAASIIIEGLKGADYLGSLLDINHTIKMVTELFGKKGNVQESILKALDRFMSGHDTGGDLGLHHLAEQLGKGLRLIEILGHKYDVVVANPPYLGLAKAKDDLAAAYQSKFETGKADLYSIFILRSLTLLRAAGRSAMVTPRGWLFISQFEDLRLKILREAQFRICGDLHLGAFSDMKDVSATMFVIQKSRPDKTPSLFVRPVPKQEIRRDQYQVGKNTGGLISQSRTYTFPQERFADIPGSPMIYWWPEEFREAYLKAKKLGEVGEVLVGCQTSNNERFVRTINEPNLRDLFFEKYEENWNYSNAYQKKWHPYVKGALGKRWFESPENVVYWHENKKELQIWIWERQKIAPAGYIKNPEYYYKQGLAFSYIGTNGFLCRLRKYRSIFDVSGSSIFCENSEKMQVLLSSSLSGYVSQSINPTINNQVGDISNLPVLYYISDYKTYLDRARALYDDLFASTETNLEYRYGEMEDERFEVEEARIRDEIDKEMLSHFSAATIASIYEEIGLSPFDYPACTAGFVPEDFAEEYQKSEGILELAHRYKLHPDSIIAIKNEMGLVHQSQRQSKAFKHLSWALGVLLGRFDATTGGLADLVSSDSASSSPNPHGLIYLSSLDTFDSMRERNLQSSTNAGTGAIASLKKILVERWGSERAEELLNEIEDALVKSDRRDSPGEWLRLDAFDRHKKIYENRPIYFPLCSVKKNFFVWVNIHRWNNATLNAVLANYLKPDLQTLEARLRRLREDIQRETDKKRQNELEDEVITLDKLHDELKAFASLVSQLAERGPSPVPGLQEVDAPFVMDLDDGIMVNSAALWELLTPLWKDPKKWWEILSKPSGKKDFDWSHMAMRYWPKRVMEKIKKDPSLAVAHSNYGAFADRDLFEELHPVAAKKWREQQGASTSANTSKSKKKGKDLVAGEMDFGE